MAERMTLERLKEEVGAIKAAVDTLRLSGLSERALLVLIQASAGNVRGKPVPQSTIRTVLDGIQGLEQFLTKEVTERIQEGIND